jgi:uncharacterized protein (DUF2164 family)
LELINLEIVKLPKEQKEQLIRRVQDYFNEERAEEIGDLAAEFLLDYMIKELGPVLYNQAIHDAIKLVAEKMFSLEDDLHAMEKPIKNIR